MKFIRRPDLDSVTRLNIALQAYFALGVYGGITAPRLDRIAPVYQRLWPLQALLAMDPLALATAQGQLLDRQHLGDLTPIGFFLFVGGLYFGTDSRLGPGPALRSTSGLAHYLPSMGRNL